MDLGPSTTVEVHRLPNGLVTSLFRGTVIASSPEGQTFQLLANGASIRPTGAQATTAQVTWVNSHELQLVSILGEIKVSFEGDVKTIEAGSSVRMEIQTEASDPPGTTGPRSHKGVKYFLIVAAPVGTVIGIWRALESPCGP
jgi:hypothetical protein